MLGRFRNARVLVTGHTGFKGSWLCDWLKVEGAVVAGLALCPEAGRPSLFEDARVGDGMSSRLGDIRDFSIVARAVEDFRPEVIFHLAAQPLVRRSYRDPILTYGTNVMGTLHVLEAARQASSVRAVVCVTTDKCYRNLGWVWGYRETDELGGQDPYSSSKAAAELVAGCYQQTMYAGDRRVALATARGGNVIGGGDWSEDRLVPDLVRAIASGHDLVIRNPEATRPWQHVLELVRGYVTLAARLLDDPLSVVGAWNFGPDRGNAIPVGDLADRFLKAWGETGIDVKVERSVLHEANFLKLDIEKAREYLNWNPVLDVAQTIEWTASWYRSYLARPTDAAELMRKQLIEYRDTFGK